MREARASVVAVDRNAEAPGLASADVAEVVDFTDVARSPRSDGGIGVDGVLTVSADRAVPVVAAVAEDLGLPGIGVDTAHRMTHKLEMRGRSPGGAFRSRRTRPFGPGDAARALETSGSRPFSARRLRRTARGLSGRQRGRSRARSRERSRSRRRRGAGGGVRGGHRDERDRDRARRRAARLTLSDRLRPPGIGFGVGWMHVYPPSIPADQLARAEQIAVDVGAGARAADGIAFPQLIAAPDGRVVVVEVAARIPGGQMADLVRHAVGVDLVEIALRQALGEEVGTSSRCRSSCSRSRSASSPRAGAAPYGTSPLDRKPRPGPRGRGSRSGRHVPRGGRDDPAGAPGRRPARLRDRGRETRRGGDATGRPGSGAADGRGRRDVSDPSTHVVERGYDGIADHFLEWRDRIVDDPRQLVAR